MKRKSRALPQHRFPFEPLAEVCARRWRPVSQQNMDASSTISKVVDVLGYDYRTVLIWADKGVRFLTADEVACKLGLHPASIWPEWFEVAA